MHYLLITGSICVTISLLEAWCMVAVRFLNIEMIKSKLVGYGFMVKSHLDYLLMSALLFSIYSVITILETQLPTVIILCMCIGALLNPFGFLVAAFIKKPPRIMTVVTYSSFLLTTTGFMGAVVTILSAVL